MTHINETAQSVISYGAAGLSSAAAATLDNVAGIAEQVTIILACVVVVVRLIYDTTRLVRYLKSRDKGK